jgi:hypothetical protein
MKQLLENLKQNWPTYFFEIFVLIIGIYGAFALESWNEKRKEQKAEISYLLAINTEFRENKQQFQNVIEAHEYALQSCQNIMEECEKKNPNADSLQSYMMGVFFTYTFDPSQSSIESLISTASIEVIQDLELRQLLISWKDLVIDYQQEELLARDHFYHRILPYLEDTYDFRKDLEVDKIEPKLTNMMETRAINIEQILDNRDGERRKIESTMNRIIELTQPKP